uniref:G_PROTEIN_RECEP_F2_4 domain-containing protein n=1 Tax=Parastrongyloides trichosuri TaxID=131310 RepID=A0A0N4ZAJ2_PARTI
MGWYCFRFWLVYRFALAVLAHLNFGFSLEVDCVYFCLWKAYDLMWFWMHFLICICVPALRPENYLLVVINLIWKKCSTYRDKSYKFIYNDLYNWKKSKVELDLERIQELEDNKKKNKELGIDSDDEDDNVVPISSIKEIPPPKRLYPDLPEVVDKTKIDDDISDKETNSSDEFDREIDDDFDEKMNEHDPGSFKAQSQPMLLKKSKEINAHKNDTRIGNILGKIPLKKINPLKLVKKSDDSKSPVSEEEKKEREEVKARLKKEKEERKALINQIKAKRKAELEILAKKEKHRRNVANIIEHSLNAWRMMASFAILVGNSRKTFLPNEILKPGEFVKEHDPEFLMFFSATLFLEIFLFWIRIFWTHIQHWKLCCQLGLFKHILWLTFVVVVGIVTMYIPMHLVHEDLDVTWCKIKNDSQYKWIQDVVEYEF